MNLKKDRLQFICEKIVFINDAYSIPDKPNRACKFVLTCKKS